MNDDEAPTVARMGFFPLVTGADVRMQQAGAMAVLARADLALSQGGGRVLFAGGDLSIREGGGLMILSRGEVSIREGGALITAGANMDVQNGWVGLALGRHVNLTSSRLLLGPVQALSLGAALGVGFALAQRLFSRSSPSRS